MKLRIFYLDDEELLCELFQDLFESDQVEIKTYTDPQLFLKDSKKNPPEIYFLDYRLPGYTGLELAKQLPKDSPKYLVTGEIDCQGTEDFTKVFTKPFDYKSIEDELMANLSTKIAA